MLGEASTTRIAKDNDVQGFIENKEAAKEGGRLREWQENSLNSEA